MSARSARRPGLSQKDCFLGKDLVVCQPMRTALTGIVQGMSQCWRYIVIIIIYYYLWSPNVIGQTIYIFILFLLLFFLA